MANDPAPASSEDDPSADPADVERPASAAGAEVIETAEAAAARHDPYAALRYPSYVLLTVGWFVAVIGHAIQATAIGWEIFERTGSKLQLGYIAGIEAIPLLVLALPAGHLADTFDRRRIILIAQSVAAMCSFTLAMLSYREGSIPWMYAVIVLSATALVLGRPARGTLLPLVVPPAVFANAVTWNSSIFQIAGACGPALGGLAIALSLHWFDSLALSYTIAGMLIGSFGILALFIRTRPFERPATQDRSLLAGLRFVFKTRIVLATMSLDLFAVLLGGTTYLLPVFAIEILQISSVGFGWLKSAEAIGAFLMTITLAHLPPMKRAGWTILGSVAGFGIATIIFGLSRNFYLSFAMLFLIGAFDSISVVVRHTLVQILTPDHMRGRVAAVNNVFIGASNQLGGLESGVTAALLGAVGSVVMGGVGTLLIVAAIAICFPQVRRLKTLESAKEAEASA